MEARGSMEKIVQHPWRALLLTNLSLESISIPLADEHPQWKYINEEMITLGSLAVNQHNIAKIQTKAISLLAHESKDCRLFSYLLQTLQHDGIIANLLLALTLLADYVDHFWSIAWPTNTIHKRRLTQQILKRFARHAAQFTDRASLAEQAEAQHQFSRLQMRWRKDEPRLAQQINKLALQYQPAVTQLDLLTEPTSDNKGEPAVNSHSLLADKAVLLDKTGQAKKCEQQQKSSSTHKKEKLVIWPQNNMSSLQRTSWQDTLLNIAELLCEKHPDLPIGYLLRRTAIWGDIKSIPHSAQDHSTLYITPPAEHITTYFNALSTAAPHLWQQLEQSLPDHPYWFDGHYFSAHLASKQGHLQVAEAIRDELQQFLQRLPALRELTFADGSPFLSITTTNWLAKRKTPESATAVYADKQQEKIWLCYHKQGLEAALRAVEEQQQQQQEPRDRFYSQLLSTRLLEKAGFNTLAQQHYLNLLLAGKQLAVIDWEPSLFKVLQRKIPKGC